MKEKPIIFSTFMVKAILEGRKTQTRRVIKTPPYEIHEHGDTVTVTKPRKFRDEDARFYPYAPYSVGDVLWVRETSIKVPWTYEVGEEESHKYFYRADGEMYEQADLNEEIDKWLPSIFMPREAARIFLEITSVRVGRLQDISGKDCHAEGAVKLPATCIIDMNRRGNEFISDFRVLWDFINTKRGFSWDSNPWVWVIEFRRIKK